MCYGYDDTGEYVISLKLLKELKYILTKYSNQLELKK